MSRWISPLTQNELEDIIANWSDSEDNLDESDEEDEYNAEIKLPDIDEPQERTNEEDFDINNLPIILVDNSTEMTTNLATGASTSATITNCNEKVHVTRTKMTEEENVNGNSEESEKSQKKGAKYDSGAADLEKVTDYAEEKEISTQNVAGAISAIGDRRNKEALEKQAREKELLKVSIKKEDVDLIVKEMEITRILAERTLREHHGNVVKALIALTD
ncbi:huntingtin-interacting protein k family member [Holotrichia oblita]|uniref:Huntingtin-interacting protein k family member n=1 Tax=Holotrichia oblita TaxID=644536 RepID=A0ACB9TY57_HOLOL|nr:huntingtin-interacting protein k family member [Holotrichia oblita]